MAQTARGDVWAQVEEQACILLFGLRCAWEMPLTPAGCFRLRIWMGSCCTESSICSSMPLRRTSSRCVARVWLVRGAEFVLQDRLCQGSVPTLSSRCPLQAYRQLAKSHHPDKPGGSAARFAKIQDAFATLADPKKRLVYDTWARELRFRYIDAQRVSLNQLPERLPAASMLRLTCHQDQHEALGYLRYDGGSRLQGVRMCCSMPLPSQAYTATRSPSWWSPVRSAGGLPPRSAGRAACRSASSAPSSATGRYSLQLSSG